MVTDQLYEYIKYAKSLGDDDDKIKNDLIQHNWIESDIDQVLNKINKISSDTPYEIQQKDRENVFVIDETTSHPATLAKTNVEVPVGTKPKVISSVISILFLVISFLLIYKAGIMITIMSIVDHISYSTGAIYYFLKEFPLYGWVIMAFSISASIFFYASVKLRGATRSSFWFGVFSLLFLPVSLSYINYKLMYSISKYFSSESIVLGQNAPKIPAGTSTLVLGVLGEPSFFLSLITLVLLLISFKKFSFPKQKLSVKNLKVLVAFLVLFTIPSACLVYSGYSKAKNDDFGYKNVKSRVSYHVYRPDPLPLGIVYASNFVSDRELAGKRNAIQVTYDFAFEKSPNMTDSRPIVVKQTSVSNDLILSDYLAIESGVYSIQKPVSISSAEGNTGYLIQNRLGEGGYSKNLIYKTSDNVLISISTVDSSEFDLIDLANSLK